jgi:hypothetical protein
LSTTSTTSCRWRATTPEEREAERAEAIVKPKSSVWCSVSRPTTSHPPSWAACELTAFPLGTGAPLTPG